MPTSAPTSAPIACDIMERMHPDVVDSDACIDTPNFQLRCTADALFSELCKFSCSGCDTSRPTAAPATAAPSDTPTVHQATDHPTGVPTARPTLTPAVSADSHAPTEVPTVQAPTATLTPPAPTQASGAGTSLTAPASDDTELRSSVMLAVYVLAGVAMISCLAIAVYQCRKYSADLDGGYMDPAATMQTGMHYNVAYEGGSTAGSIAPSFTNSQYAPNVPPQAGPRHYPEFAPAHSTGVEVNVGQPEMPWARSNVDQTAAGSPSDGVPVGRPWNQAALPWLVPKNALEADPGAVGASGGWTEVTEGDGGTLDGESVP